MKPTVPAIALILIASLGASDAEAHWRPFRHRHLHPARRRVIVVGAPVRVRNVVVVDGKPRGTLDFHVDPSQTEVYVDGTLRGTADDFDGLPQKLHLVPGLHKITLKTPDGESVTRNIDIRAGTELEIRLDFDQQ
jgi:hypothetical protein